MRIAFACYKYFPFGGLQRDLVRIGQVCRARGHEVHLIVKEWAEGEVPEGFVRHVLPGKGWSNHAQCMDFAQQLDHWLPTQSFDLVVGFNKLPGLQVYYAADRCYAEKMAKQHGAWYQLTPRYRVFASLERQVFDSNADVQIMLIAPREQAVFQRHFNTPSTRFHCLPPGISKDRLAPEEADQIRVQKRHSMGWNDDEKIVLLVGSGFKTKGLDRAIRAVAALPDALRKTTRLLVLGYDKFDAYGRLAKRLGIGAQVSHLGGRDDVPELLLAADLLIHPAYNENTGTVLLEAMCAGLPVLATDECGYAHYVTEAGGGVIHHAPFDQSRLGLELTSMLSEDARATMGQKGLAFAQTHDLFSLPETAATLLEQFASARPR